MKDFGTFRGMVIGVLTVFLLILLVVSCDLNSTKPGTTGRLVLYISDDPGEFDQVNIVVTRVEAHKSGGSWFVVTEEENTFDLLELSNGVMAVLADAELEPGKYTQLRLILGDGSNVVVDGDSHPLAIPSGLQTGLKLVHEFDLEADYTYELLLDFNVHHSIHTSALGYMLKPTVRIQPLALTGVISGLVEPVGINPVVSVIAADTVMSTAYPDDETGSFKFLGIPAGTYGLEVNATGYVTEVMNEVAVQVGQTTNVGTIELQEE
jgi:hypothetical protein